MYHDELGTKLAMTLTDAKIAMRMAKIAEALKSIGTSRLVRDRFKRCAYLGAAAAVMDKATEILNKSNNSLCEINETLGERNEAE